MKFSGYILFVILLLGLVGIASITDNFANLTNDGNIQTNENNANVISNEFEEKPIVDFKDLSGKNIKQKDFTKKNDGVQFNRNVKDVNNFKVEKDTRSIHVELIDEEAEISRQTIGISISDLPGFNEYVRVEHFNEFGNWDYEQIIKPMVIDDVVYIDVEFSSVTITPYGTDNAYITGSSNDTVAVLNTTTNTVTQYINTSDEPNAIVVNNAGTRAYVASNAGYLNIINTTNNSNITTVSIGTGVMDLCISPDDRYVYIASADIEVLDTTTNTITNTIGGYYTPRGVAVSNDGKTLYVSNYGNGTVGITNISTEVTTYVAVGTTPAGARLSPDNTMLYVPCYTPAKVYVINTTSQTVVTNITTQAGPRALAVSADGSKVYVCCISADRLSIIWTANNTVKTNITSGNDPRGITASPIGNKMYVANTAGNSVSIVNTTTDVIDTTVTGISGPYSFGFVVRGSNVPTASYTANVTSGTTPLTVSFTDTSINEPTAWSWNFSDGTSNSTLQNPTHTFSSAGTYNVSVNASNVAGYSIYTDVITVSSTAPVANFTANITSGAVPTTISFTDSSTNTPTSWQWSFGDGTSNSTSQNPTHTYSSAGTYTVTLTATNVGGSGVKTRTNYITISDPAGSNNAYIPNQWNDTVAVVNTSTNTIVNTITVGSSPFGSAVSPDGARVYIVNKDSNTVSVINTATNTVIATINVGTAPYCAVVSPDNSKVYVTNYGSNSTTVINATTNTVITNVTVGWHPRGIAVAPNGSKVYVANWDGDSVSVINASSNTVTNTVSLGGDVYGIAASNTNIYACMYFASKINIIDAATETITSNITVGTNPFGVAIAPDISRIYVTNYGGNSVSVINATNKSVITTVSVGTNPMGVAFSTDESKAYIANWDSNTVSVINTTNNSIITNITGFNHPNGLGIFIRKLYIPISSFTMNTSAIVAPRVVQFTDTSLNSPTNWEWNFGDGITSTEQNPIHNYTSAGNYTVSLNVSGSVSSQTISVYTTNPTNITWSGYTWRVATSGPGSNTFGTSNGSVWIDDQNRLHLAVRNINGVWVSGEVNAINYTKYGIYTWNVSSPLFQFDKNIIGAVYTYGNDTEELDFESGIWNDSARPNGQFCNQPTWIGDINASWNRYSMNITDNGQPYEIRIIYMPTFVQFYINRSDTTLSSWNLTNATEVPTISMKSSMNCWQYRNIAPSNGLTQELILNSYNYDNYTTPVADFSANVTSGANPKAILFTDSSTNTPTSWQWNFGDGTANATTQNPTHTYTSTGTFTVTLTATNTAGSSVRTRSSYITITDPAPVADFSANTTSGTAPKTILFTDASTNTPTSWQWNFGDGTSNATTQNVLHTYTSAGTYTVTLTATNAGGNGVKTITNYITISGPAPVADFSANITSGTKPKVILFTDLSTNTPTSWAWNFGDGTSNSTSQNPTHNYTVAGTYTVTLTATNAAGSGVKTRTNYITIVNPGSAVPSFTYSGPSSATQFQDTSTGDPSSWLWDFGDGATSTEQNPLHAYSTPGTYQVKLTVDKEGVTANHTNPVTVQLGAPKNYSQYYQKFFVANMTGWDFVTHTGDFWESIVPAEFLWAIIILIPFITIYNRTGTIIIPALLYLFAGGVLATVMPPMLGQFYYWFLILGAGGIIYKLYVGE